MPKNKFQFCDDKNFQFWDAENLGVFFVIIIYSKNDKK